MGAMGVIIFKKENSLDYIVEVWRKKEVLLPERGYYTQQISKSLKGTWLVHTEPTCELLEYAKKKEIMIYTKKMCHLCAKGLEKPLM